MRFRSFVLQALTFVLVAAACPVGAQVIEGRLLDHATDAPVATGSVELIAPTGAVARRTVTDSLGRFTIHAPIPGRYELRAERIGYRTVTSPPIQLHGTDTIQVDLHIATDVIPLAPLTVTAAPRPPIRQRRLDEFYERQRRGFGTFFGPEMIEQLRPHNVSTLLQQVAGMRVENPRGWGATVTMRRIGGRGECVPTIIVDGHSFRPDPELTLDDLVPAIGLRAVEVYRAGQVPATFASGINWECGAVVVWTELSVDG